MKSWLKIELVSFSKPTLFVCTSLGYFYFFPFEGKSKKCKFSSCRIKACPFMHSISIGQPVKLSYCRSKKGNLKSQMEGKYLFYIWLPLLKLFYLPKRKLKWGTKICTAWIENWGDLRNFIFSKSFFLLRQEIFKYLHSII